MTPENDSRFVDDDNDVFARSLAAYLALIGGPTGPTDSPINPRSHHVLRHLHRDFGKGRVDRALDQFFSDNPNW